MSTNWKAPVLAFLGLAALAVAVPVSVANAQEKAQNTQDIQQTGQTTTGQRTQRTVQDYYQDPARFQQRGQGAGQDFRQGQPPQQGGPDMMMQRGMMGMGPATMVVDNQFLYILQGNQIYKVNKNTLEVVATGMLPMPMPGQPRFGGGPDGAPGVRGGGAGGGVATGGGAAAGGGGTAK